LFPFRKIQFKIKNYVYVNVIIIIYPVQLDCQSIYFQTSYNFTLNFAVTIMSNSILAMYTYLG